MQLMDFAEIYLDTMNCPSILQNDERANKVMNMTKLEIAGAFAVALTLFSATAWAQEDADPMMQPAALKEAAQAAVLNNPEVHARWHAFREADEDIGVARG